MRVTAAVAALLVVVLASPVSTGQSRGGTPDHWVSTWATSLQLAPSTFGGRGGRGGPGRGAAPAPGGRAQEPPVRRVAPEPPNVPLTMEDQTVRMIVRTSIGGSSLRVSLSNMTGAQPLQIGAAHVAAHRGGGAIDPKTDRVLLFGGQPTIVVPPGALVVSDPVRLDLAPLADLAVSLYLPHDTGPPTTHNIALRTGYIASGNAAASETINAIQTVAAYLWLSSVDVLAPAQAFAIVALGDSITDGYATTHDANRAWPALLATRLSRDRRSQTVAVLNQGISGNQVLRDGAGLSMLARFDRDVLGRPGVRWVILLGGINDINIRGRTDGPAALTAEELIAGYGQIIARSHMHGVKVIGATLTPEEGYRPPRSAVRRSGRPSIAGSAPPVTSTASSTSTKSSGMPGSRPGSGPTSTRGTISTPMMPVTRPWPTPST